jgi:serine phosphatase RsbU (regulator of sigma subunit)
MLCVSFDLTERVIRYANAGHEFPILIQPSLNRWEYLESTGPMLGVNPSQPYSEQTIPLHEQDILVCHTDGLSDAIGQDGQPFGRQRIESTILGHKEKTVQELADLLGVAWSEYAGDRATDDMTLVVARCLVLRGRSPA